MLSNDFYKIVLELANDEVERLNKIHNLTELNKQQLHVQAVSASTMLVYHSELSKELKKHNIDIGEITFSDN